MAKKTDKRKYMEEAGDLLFNYSSDMLCIADFDGYFKQVSPSFTKILGWSADELFAKPVTDFVHSDDRKATARAIKAHETGKEATHFLNRYLCKDGTYKWISWNAHPLVDKRLIVGVGRDITEHKEAERKLQESEAMLARAQQIAHVGYWDRDLSTEILRWSDETYRIFGFQPQECQVNAEFFLQRLHPDDRARVAKARGEAAEGAKPYDVIFRSVRPDGSVCWVHTLGEVARTPDGKPARIFGTVLDITERKSAEELLQEYEKVVEGSDDMIAIVDRDYRFRLANDAFLQYRGICKKEIIGRSAEEILGRDVFERVVKKNLEKCFHGEVVRWEMKQTYPELGERDLRVSYLPIRGPEGVDRVTAIIRDITERKRAEEALRKAHDELETLVQQKTMELRQAYERLKEETREREQAESQLRQAQKMEALGALAGGIAHDFNNMLAVILGNTELALDEVQDENGIGHNLAQILKASRRGRDLVKQILTFSRKSNKKRNAIDMNSLLKETFRLLRSSIPANIEIALDMEAQDAATVADPSEIQQIIMNLASNAEYAMRDDGGKLTFRVHDQTYLPGDRLPAADMEPGDYVILTVSDTGAGMTAKTQEKIFDPFFTTKEIGQGTGMGLAVVYGILKNLNGAVTVHSEPGKGATFHVFLPKASPLREDRQEERGLPPGGKERILFVDDEEAVAETGKAVLERLGYQVTATTDGEKALELFLEDTMKYDMVITDHAMPHITGIKLAEKMIKARKDIPIILCTGYSHTASPEGAKAIGIRGFLMKPVAKKELAETVRRVLDSSNKA
jgi:PAS domain S-box-containing protein